MVSSGGLSAFVCFVFIRLREFNLYLLMELSQQDVQYRTIEARSASFTMYIIFFTMHITFSPSILIAIMLCGVTLFAVRSVTGAS